MTVKGPVERKVKSDQAIWPLGYKEAGDDPASLHAKTRNQGVFTILQTDQGSEGGEGGENPYAADSSLTKAVRVETSVHYHLDG